MKRLMKLSSIGLALAMMLTTVAQAQEERKGRDGADRERGQQGQGQGAVLPSFLCTNVGKIGPHPIPKNMIVPYCGT